MYYALHSIMCYVNKIQILVLTKFRNNVTLKLRFAKKEVKEMIFRGEFVS